MYIHHSFPSPPEKRKRNKKKKREQFSKKTASYESLHGEKLRSTSRGGGTRDKQVSSDKHVTSPSHPRAHQASLPGKQEKNPTTQIKTPKKSHREVASLLLLPLSSLIKYSESLALETLVASLASTHRLPPHCTVSSSGSGLLLSRVGTGALSAHGPGASERVVATTAADVDHASRRELGGCWLWGDL